MLMGCSQPAFTQRQPVVPLLPISLSQLDSDLMAGGVAILDVSMRFIYPAKIVQKITNVPLFQTTRHNQPVKNFFGA